MLYEVAILERPTKKKKDEGITEKLVLPPTPIVAPDEKTAAIIAGKDANLDNVAPDRMEVLVRPFCGNETDESTYAAWRAGHSIYMDIHDNR